MIETKPMTEEEQKCEDLFATTHRRDDNGRYIVRLPVREEVELGQSQQIGMKSLESGKRGRQKDSDLNEAYLKFMGDYKSMHHMAVVAEMTNAIRVLIICLTIRSGRMVKFVLCSMQRLKRHQKKA